MTQLVKPSSPEHLHRQKPSTLPNVTSSPETTVKPHRSYSQLSMFERCSMQYYFRYELGRIERPTLRLKNGLAGHTAVEFNQKKKIATGVDQPVDTILDVFSDAYDSQVADLEPTDLKPGDDIGHTKDATIQTLIYHRIKDAPSIEPLAVELPFSLKIPRVEDYDFEVPEIVGRIDTVEKRGIADNKFLSRAKNQAHVDMLDQLTLYDLAVKEQTGLDMPSVGLRMFLPPTTREGGRTITIWRDPLLMQPARRAARHERLLYKFRTVERQIQHGEFLPADDPIVCSWCGFREICQESLVKSDYEALKIRQATGER